MSLFVIATVLVKESCPDALYRGKHGIVVDGPKWGMWRVEIVIDGVTYKPLIAAGHLEKIAPESEATSYAQGTCPNCGHDYTAHSAWIAHPGDTTCEEAAS